MDLNIGTDHACSPDFHCTSRTITNEAISVDESAVSDLQITTMVNIDKAFDVGKDVEYLLVKEFYFGLQGHTTDDVTPCDVFSARAGIRWEFIGVVACQGS
jgi:hypothetical protein